MLLQPLFILLSSCMLYSTLSFNFLNANTKHRSILIGTWKKTQRFLVISSIISSITMGSSTMRVEAVDDPTSIQRFDKSLLELQDLEKNWDSIVRGEGDNIRRKLGTVYAPPKCQPALCNYQQFISSFAKKHPDDLDIVSFDEPSRELLQAINQADFLAYSSVFSSYGNGGGGVDYLEQSKSQIHKAIELLEEVIRVVKSD